MQLIGQMGEHIVAVDLMRRGYMVSMASPGYPYDLVADVGGQTYRVQVKATSKLSTEKGYTFRTKGNKHRNYDLIAFVAVDTNTVAYKPFYEAAKNTNKFQPPGTPTHGRRKGQNLDQYSFEDAVLALENYRKKLHAA